ncbi:CBS domain-containing protein [Streptomyces brevispora]|uniref:CBS domain protein n=1 Tax=Streptomyces brevispora TaxID=887462 RepID=A0A561UR21_9ACTN|nr:CBS domain-containing protein [Streptomyces brevispora]TWG01804.1 CBS domain protein [Streptomyces brevispora]WSC16986.1 CBS domain-containing protein [Streptomyces brevispora]
MPRSPYTVGEVMTAPVVALYAGAGFKEIAATLKKWRITAMPVLDGERRVIGVVSEADLLAKEEFHDRQPGMIEQQRLDRTAKAGSVSAGDLMTAPALTVRADATLPQAARIMARNRVKRLPVVNGDGVLTGVVSRSDLLKVFLRPDDDIAAEVRRDVVELVFPVSHRHVHVTVSEGVVTLTGTVPERDHISLAERLAHTVEGVVAVECVLSSPPYVTGSPAL